MPRTKTAERTHNRKRLAKAILELLRNPETPEFLDDKLTDFLCEAENGAIAARYTQVPGGLQALEHLLAFREWQQEEWDKESGRLQAASTVEEVSHATN